MMGTKLPQKLQIIDSEQGIRKLEQYLLDKEYIAYDSETNGLPLSSTVIGFSVCAEEDKAFYVILQKWAQNPIQNALLLPANQLIQVLPNSAVLPLLELLKTKKLIMHNAIFDCAIAEAYFKVRLIDALHTDTMILAHLLNENRRVGLKELARAYFGEDAANEQAEMKASVLANGGKLTKDQYEMYKCDAYIMAKYGAKDALLTYKLFLELVPELYAQNLDQFFYEDEAMPLLKGPTYELNTIGVKVDQTELLKLKKTLEAECLEAKAFIMAEIQARIQHKYPGTNKRNTFNIGASQQLSWLLFGQLNLEFDTLTKGGKDACRSLGLRLPYTAAAKRDFISRCLFDKGLNLQPEAIVNGKKVKAKKLRDPWAYIACDKKTLKKLSHKYKWIERLLEFNSKMKLLSTYVIGIEERLQYGIIRSSYLQQGTTSGRYASRNPNFQNLPRDDKRIKSCIISRPGKVFVGADYSQLEPRVFAYFSNDKRLLASFNGTDDFYSTIGMEVYGKYDCTPQKDGSNEAFGVKYKGLRDLSKVIALASTYGATAKQLSPTTGKSISETQEDMDSYFERFPDVKKFMLDSHRIAKETGQVTNLFGRPRRIPDAKKINKLYGNIDHAELPYEARNLLNLAVNHRVQSTGASIVNRAAIMAYNLCKDAKIDAKLVMQVHDSLVLECFEEDKLAVADILQHSMENAVHLEGIRLEAKPRLGLNLGKI